MARKAEAHEPLKTIKVMMLGGQRTGKTTVLNSMYRNFDKIFNGSHLMITSANSETLLQLDNKQTEIDKYYRVQNITFVPDDNPTEGYSRYGFDINITGKDDFVRLEFYDFKGEWLKNEDHLDDLRDEIAESEVFMIVIDTPYMMERGDDGESFNQMRNNCRVISDILKKHLSHSGPKTVLFVPLKCEKYRSEGRMAEVCKAIKDDDCYGNLITFLTNSNDEASGKQTYFEIAITPIFTMGTLEFVEFERTEAQEDQEGNITGGEIILDPQYGPKRPLYTRTGPKHEPGYCEQPLLYGLCHALYIAACYKKNEELARSWFVRLKDWIRDNILEKFMKQYDSLSRSRDFYIAYLKLLPMIRQKLEDASIDGYELIKDDFKYKELRI